MSPRLGHIPSRFIPRHAPVIVDAADTPALSAGSVREFETRWDEERWLRDVMSGWRETRRSRETPADETRTFIDRAARRRELVRDRLAHGFVFHGGEVAGRLRAPFREAGLRSDENHVLRRLVHASPKGSRLQSGRSKNVMSGTDAKILGLDEPWIVLNREVRSVFGIDLDHVFPSWAALRYELEELRLPCLPNAVVGFEDEDGKVERPHALFMLPYNGGAGSPTMRAAVKTSSLCSGVSTRGSRRPCFHSERIRVLCATR